MVLCYLANSLLTAGLAWQPRSQMDDRDVLQTVVLTVLKDASAKHRYAVVDPHWYSQPRGSYGHDLQDAIDGIRFELEQSGFDSDWQKEVTSQKATLAKLIALRNEARSSGRYSSPSIRPLASYSWDKQITFDDKAFFGWGMLESLGKRGARIENAWFRGNFALPAYSVDGQFSVVSHSFPEGMHFGTSTYFLSREGRGWVVVAEKTDHYL